MSSAIFTTQITRKYLMNKSKSDMADLALWIIDMKCKKEERFDEILTKITEALDDENIPAAMAQIRIWDNENKPFDR